MVVTLITVPLLLYILYMAMVITVADTDEDKEQKALQDIQGDVKDKEKQKLSESMGKSLVATYEYIMKSATEPGKSAHIGCFSLTSGWDPKKPDKINLAEKNTANACIWKCWEKRHRFALLWYGAQCWCISVIRHLKDEGDHSCATPCKGNATQICGGPEKCSIYYTGYVHEPLYTHVTAKEITAAFEGCFHSSQYKSKCPVSPPSHRMSVPTCMDVCENNLFRFAGLSSHDRCCCDHNLTVYTKAKQGDCGYNCRYGGKDYSCGGKNSAHFSVYETGASKIVEGLKTSITKQIWMEADVDEDDIQVVGGKKAGA